MENDHLDKIWVEQSQKAASLLGERTYVVVLAYVEQPVSVKVKKITRDMDKFMGHFEAWQAKEGPTFEVLRS